MCDLSWVIQQGSVPLQVTLVALSRWPVRKEYHIACIHHKCNFRVLVDHFDHLPEGGDGVFVVAHDGKGIISLKFSYPGKAFVY